MQKEPSQPAPGGVLVPAALINDPTLPPAAFHTWAFLRGLAGPESETPPCALSELSRLTGKSRTVLYTHLALLRSRHALGWRSDGKGALIITFDVPPEPAVLPDASAAAPPACRQDLAAPAPEEPPSAVRESGIRDSGFPDSKTAPSLNPLNIKNLESKRELKERGDLRKSGFPDSGIFEPSTHPARDSVARDPVALYRQLTGRRPNSSQRLKLAEQVTDLDLWRRTVEHWQMHGWNPLNLAGILDLYQRGGPPTCRYCRENGPGPQKPAASRLPTRPPMLEVLDQLRKDHPHGRKP